jgi:propanol-preferring alcohol dehydrogenase
MVIPEDFAYLIPQSIPITQAAPLLCAGAVGLRSLRMTGIEDGDILGLTGFGSSGRLVLQMARILYPHSPVYVFARSEAERAIADGLGANWTGISNEKAPQKMTAIIDTTPVWLPALNALEQLQAGGRLIINALRKETTDQDVLLKLNYAEHLWHEKTIQSVANVSRKDVRGVLALASQNPLRIDVVEYSLEQALDALLAIKSGDIKACSVLAIAQQN